MGSQKIAEFLGIGAAHQQKPPFRPPVYSKYADRADEKRLFLDLCPEQAALVPGITQEGDRGWTNWITPRRG